MYWCHKVVNEAGNLWVKIRKRTIRTIILIQIFKWKTSESTSIFSSSVSDDKNAKPSDFVQKSGSCSSHKSKVIRGSNITVASFGNLLLKWFEPLSVRWLMILLIFSSCYFFQNVVGDYRQLWEHPTYWLV